MDLSQVQLPRVDPQTPKDVQLNFRRIELNRLSLVQAFPDPSAVTASATLTAYSQTIFANATAGNVALTTPAAAGNTGVRYAVFKTDTSTNTVTIAGFTLGGNSGNSRITVVSDGTNWKLEMLYDEGTYPAVLTGCTTSPTVTVSYVKNGKQVTAKTSATLSATSNTTACDVTGCPAHLFPAAAQNATIDRVFNNSLDNMGFINVGTGGVWTPFFWSAINTRTGTYTNVGTKGIGLVAISYISA